MDDKTTAVIVGIICITVIEVIAIHEGINGTLLAAVIGAITTVIGFLFGYTQGRKT